jgi:signal transduction histidine kinase
VQRSVDITDRLLLLTEPGGNSRALRLDVLVRDVLALHRGRFEEDAVRLVLDLAETPPVEGDEVRLRFVLSSLIDNALDSMVDRPERTLRVSTGRTEEFSHCTIEDSGCGVSERNLARIFSPFFSEKGEWAPPGSPQARLRGVGLSLAISNMAVSECGGRIEARSNEGGLDVLGAPAVHGRVTDTAPAWHARALASTEESFHPCGELRRPQGLQHELDALGEQPLALDHVGWIAAHQDDLHVSPVFFRKP